MDLRLSEEERLIRDTAAQFVHREMLTREKEYLRQAELFLPPGDPPRRELDPKIRNLLVKISSRIGIWALEFPPALESPPMSVVARVLVQREFGRTALPFEPASIPGVMASTAYAKALAEGKISLSLAFDQIHRTGNIEAVATTYRAAPDGYIFSDSRMDMLNPEADLFLLPAREADSGRVGLFLLASNAPGVSIGAAEDLTPDGTVAVLTLHQCKLPKGQLLGHEAEVATIIAAEQFRIAGRCLGIGMRCLADSIQHARTRVTFGRPLAQRQAIQWMLADLSSDIAASNWLTLEAAWRADNGMPYPPAAARAKKRAAKMAFQAADAAIQIHGGYGVSKELPFESFYREARMLRLLYGRELELDRAAGERFINESARRCTTGRTI